MKVKAKTLELLKPKVTLNQKIKSNPSDPFIQKKLEKATELLKSLKEPLHI